MKGVGAAIEASAQGKGCKTKIVLSVIARPLRGSSFSSGGDAAYRGPAVLKPFGPEAISDE
eukprot:CAMPEP_0113688350 /NCGR_PEP_ID=MMETSP0038_2-20120614/16475_1 /TAXON_ID=2898 /ORGANISM="Cryptomonas paramecium" /LENGTH=60 /DNA_ID=CAMNT_0000609131 /DNA_START=389 /DNA_END=572 /DNA_ORIENTATION=+ /assembly_acc=CAM_ASM_000170